MSKHGQFQGGENIFGSKLTYQNLFSLTKKLYSKKILFLIVDN